METPLPLVALEKAVTKLNPPRGVVHHSNRGLAARDSAAPPRYRTTPAKSEFAAILVNRSVKGPSASSVGQHYSLMLPRSTS
jgi:hypothetical protein